MKYILLLSASVLLFGSCKKKQPDTNCYICELNESHTGSPASMVSPKYFHGTVTICDWNETQKSDYVFRHTYTDTFYWSGSDLILAHHTANCIIQ